MKKVRRPRGESRKAFGNSLQQHGMMFIAGTTRSCRLKKILFYDSKKRKKDGSRPVETERRFGKNIYEPYMGHVGKDSQSREDNQRYDHKSRNSESGSSSRFRNEQNNYESRDNDRSLKARFGGYNFNVNTFELVAILRSM